MSPIRLRDAVRRQIVAHARAVLPEECCGLLVGADSLVDECVPVRNVHETPATRYLIDPAAHIALNRRLRGTGRSVVGCYHSHPRSLPVPSPTDVAEAHYPEFVWIIVSLLDAPGVLAAYRLDGRGFMPVDIVAVQDAG